MSTTEDDMHHNTTPPDFSDVQHDRQQSQQQQPPAVSSAHYSTFLPAHTTYSTPKLFAIWIGITVLRLAYTFGCLLFVAVCGLCTKLYNIVVHPINWITCSNAHSWRSHNNARTDGSTTQSPYHVVIVGGGLSGIGMAMKLRQLDLQSFTLYELNHSVGGTWYSNTYPGCECDIQAVLYQFSFCLSPYWTMHYATQQQIVQYLQYCIQLYGLQPYVQCNTRVLQCEWLSSAKLWRLTIQRGDSDAVQKVYARMLINSQGVLVKPSTPHIRGLSLQDSSTSQRMPKVWHSAYWRHDVGLQGKRVAVIGTGASAVQIISALQPIVSKLTVYQRTPHYILPRNQSPISTFAQMMYLAIPCSQRFVRARQNHFNDSVALATSSQHSLIGDGLSAVAIGYLEESVRNAELRQKLRPNNTTGKLGCKRILLSDTYYKAITQRNVVLHTSGISHFDAQTQTLHTVDGDADEVDIIIFASGFSIHASSLQIVNSSGKSSIAADVNDKPSVTIDIADTESVSATESTVSSSETTTHHHQYAGNHQSRALTESTYKGVTQLNMPNHFSVLGYNSGISHNSITLQMETQFDYICQALVYADKHKIQQISVKASAVKQYNAWVQQCLSETVWMMSNCRSWFHSYDSSSNTLRNTASWPFSALRYRWMMRSFDAHNYELVK